MKKYGLEAVSIRLVKGTPLLSDIPVTTPMAAVAEEQPEFSVNDSCPYCQIKAAANTKTIFETLQPKDGTCPDCGAYIDVGQHKVKMNGYADIYKGAVRLLGEMVGQFNELLNCCDVNLEDYLDDDEDGKVRASMRTSEIIEQLFVPYVGGTTKSNLKNALGIKEDWLSWIVSGKGEDEQDKEVPY